MLGAILNAGNYSSDRQGRRSLLVYLELGLCKMSGIVASGIRSVCHENNSELVSNKALDLKQPQLGPQSFQSP